MNETELPVLAMQPEDPKLYPAEFKAKAYDLYLNKGLNHEDIAITLSVPRSAVVLWSRQGGWDKRRETVELELYKASENNYRRIVSLNKVPTLERHIEASKKIEEIVIKVLDKLKEVVENSDGINKEVSTELRRLAEALSAATTISSRAVGLRDTPSFEERDVERAVNAPGGPREKQPLIVINTASGGPQVPPAAEKDGTVIDV